MIAVLVALVALGIAYAVDAAGRAARHAEPQGVVTRTIGGTTLRIPADWLSPNDHSSGGFAKEIDLSVTLPLGAKGADTSIDISLMPRSRVRPSASLLDGVYLHQFMPEQLSGPPGLVGKPMMATEGYEGETVWYDPIGQSPFAAKCQAPLAADQPGRCLRAIYLGANVAAVYSFDDTVLANWRRFDAALHPILAQIGAL